jgi:hypothetical protein
MNSSHVQIELERLQARWAALRNQVAESKRLIDLSVQYFTLVEEVRLDHFPTLSYYITRNFYRRRNGSVKAVVFSLRLLVNLQV